MTENNENNEEPKFNVDEGWKSQVEKEKEQLRQASESETSSDDELTSDVGESSDDEKVELPPASFLGLLSMLGSQAMSALGVIPDFSTGKPNVNRPLAKHCIDMIGILQEKTKNNLSDDEAAHVRDALHQLRMIFVSTAQTSSDAASGSNDAKGPSIELP